MDCKADLLSLKATDSKIPLRVGFRSNGFLNYLLHRQGHAIVYRWPPGRACIHGSELAVMEAVSTRTSQISTIPSRSDARSIIFT